MYRMRLLREERVASVRHASSGPFSRLLQLVSSLLQRPRPRAPPSDGRHANRPPPQRSAVASAATERDPVETGTVEGSQARGQCARPLEDVPAATRPATRLHSTGGRVGRWCPDGFERILSSETENGVKGIKDDSWRGCSRKQATNRF